MAKTKKKTVRKAAKAPKASNPRRRRVLRKPPTVILTVRGSNKPVEPRARPATVPPLSADQVQKFRDVLSDKRDNLTEIVQRKKEEEIEDIGVGDEADIATHSVEKEMLFELTDSEKQTLDMVEAALRKMDKGVFGICESCQRGIPRMRLQVMPWARYCISCQTEQEVPAGE